MNDYELLHLIGDVNEDYVLAAGDNVVRPRFRWKTIAASAACAALVFGAAYPSYLASFKDAPREDALPFHAYTVIEGAGNLEKSEAAPEAPAGGAASDSATDGLLGAPTLDSGAFGKEYDEDIPISDIDGDRYWSNDLPVDEEAAGQYDRLLRGMGMHGENGAQRYPDWFAGAWIDHGGAPSAPARLTVAIVEGLRTPELEGEILGWCGDGVAFQSAKYSHNSLEDLMDPVTKALDGSGLTCGIGVDVTANCLGVDLYSDGAVIPDEILAELARLDPAGDAIRVRLFPGILSNDDGQVKGAAPDVSIATPFPADTEDGEPTPTPIDGSEDVPADAVPGGAYVGGLPEGKEGSQSAQYDLLPLE